MVARAYNSLSKMLVTARVILVLLLEGRGGRCGRGGGLGVGYEKETATLTLTPSSDVELPRKNARITFGVDGAGLGAFGASELSGGPRSGSIVIECSAVRSGVGDSDTTRPELVFPNNRGHGAQDRGGRWA